MATINPAKRRRTVTAPEEIPRGDHHTELVEPRLNEEAREHRMNRIARRAYALYEARGGEQGAELEDWLAAEREIDGEREC
jgi:hypothetical protein